MNHPFLRGESSVLHCFFASFWQEHFEVQLHHPLELRLLCYGAVHTLSQGNPSMWNLNLFPFPVNSKQDWKGFFRAEKSWVFSNSCSWSSWCSLMKYSAYMGEKKPKQTCPINFHLTVQHLICVAWWKLLKEQLCVEFFPPILEVDFF